MAKDQEARKIFTIHASRALNSGELRERKILSLLGSASGAGGLPASSHRESCLAVDKGTCNADFGPGCGGHSNLHVHVLPTTLGASYVRHLSAPYLRNLLLYGVLLQMFRAGNGVGGSRPVTRHAVVSCGRRAAVEGVRRMQAL